MKSCEKVGAIIDNNPNARERVMRMARYAKKR